MGSHRFTGLGHAIHRMVYQENSTRSCTLALTQVGRRAALRGLDLSLGFLHAPMPNRPALALDLLEPVRPRVDQWVWRLLESGALRPEDFTNSSEEGCRLGKEGRSVFFREWHTSEDQWLPKPARHALAIVLIKLRSFAKQDCGPVTHNSDGGIDKTE